ncbi:MAG: YrdB family protein [Caldilineaceae bacterium]|nr:YrdB family protein [Caldilineaceae bacterium]
MGSNPINLGVRFVLELIALAAFGRWSWKQSDEWLRYLLVLGIPLLAALLWGTFAVPDDPSRSGKAPVPVPGVVRLLLELFFFALAAGALLAAGAGTFGWLYALAVAVHYALSYDRIRWLLRQ